MKFSAEYFRVPKLGSDARIKLYPDLNQYNQQVPVDKLFYI